MVSKTLHGSSLLYRVALLFFLGTTAAVVIYTMYAAFHYSSNAILGKDEANFVILSSQKILFASNGKELMEGLFPSHAQHLLFGMQLVNIFTYAIFGVLDRRIMNVIGVFILCIAGYVIIKNTKAARAERVLLFATIMPILLSPAHNACIVNASCTGNHYLGISLSVFSLYFFWKIAEKKRFFVCAELFMLLAILSLPAALALFPVSTLLIKQRIKEKPAAYFAIHFSLMLLLLAFHTYITYPNTIFSFTDSIGSVSAVDFLKNILLFVVTYLLIIGSLFYWLGDLGYSIIIIIVGVILTLFIFWLLIQHRKKYCNTSNNFYFYSILLFLLMILAICFGRYYSFGSSRYAVYMAFLSASLFLAWFNGLPVVDDQSYDKRKIKFLLCSSCISIGYFLVALHYHRGYLLDLEEKDNYCRQLWHSEQKACGVMISHEYATQLIRDAIAQGIYKVED